MEWQKPQDDVSIFVLKYYGENEVIFHLSYQIEERVS